MQTFYLPVPPERWRKDSPDQATLAATSITSGSTRVRWMVPLSSLNLFSGDSLIPSGHGYPACDGRELAAKLTPYPGGENGGPPGSGLRASRRRHLWIEHRCGQKRGCVQGTHFGLRIGPYLGRTGSESACIRETQCLRGRECSSSPTSGTCFPCSGACGPLTVYKSPLWALGGPFLLVAAGLAAPSLCWYSGVAAYSFMAGSAWTCMTC